MMKELRIESREEVKEVVADAVALRCQACSSGEREEGGRLLNELSEWWLDRGTREQLGCQTIIVPKAKSPELQNMGVTFALLPDGSVRRIPVFLYQLQHEQRAGTPKAGPHHSFQFPHGDVKKPEGAKEKRDEYANTVSHLSVKGAKSISATVALSELEFLQSEILGYSQELVGLAVCGD